MLRPGMRGAGRTVIGRGYPAVRWANWKRVRFGGVVFQDRSSGQVCIATPSAAKRRNVGDIGQLNCERTCSTEKDTLMASPTTLRSPYILRLELVRDTLKSHSKLGDKEASQLAEHVLHALNSIPEKMR
jgi:hypothetical protein